MTTNFRLALEHTITEAKRTNKPTSFQCLAFIRNCKGCYFYSQHSHCADNGSMTLRTSKEWEKFYEERIQEE